MKYEQLNAYNLRELQHQKEKSKGASNNYGK